MPEEIGYFAKKKGRRGGWNRRGGPFLQNTWQRGALPGVNHRREIIKQHDIFGWKAIEHVKQHNIFGWIIRNARLRVQNHVMRHYGQRAPYCIAKSAQDMKRKFPSSGLRVQIGTWMPNLEDLCKIVMGGFLDVCIRRFACDGLIYLSEEYFGVFKA